MSVRILTDMFIPQSLRWERTVIHVTQGLSRPRKRILQGLVSLLGAPLVHLIVIMLRARESDVVINGNLRTAQALGLMRTALKMASPQQIVLEVMLDEEQKGWLWQAKRRLQEAAFRKIEIIFVSSTGEVATYSQRLKLPPGRVRYLPFHTNIVVPKLVRGGDYLLSAGRTGRDFATLCKAAENVACKILIVSDLASVRGVRVPPNVELLVDIPYERYLEFLFGCRAVVVPLTKVVKSTGQVVILEAMALGKPVIATETVGTIDYIEDGVNGILVPVGSASALKEAILRLTSDDPLCRTLSAGALRSVMERHTFDSYVNVVLRAANELGQARGIDRDCARE